MYTLDLEKRDKLRKTRELRSKGIVPGVMYGKRHDSTCVKLPMIDIFRAMNKKGEIFSVYHGQKKKYVKFDEIQRHPVTHEILHFSLVALPKMQTSEVDIPVNLKGVPVGVKKGGVLVLVKDEVTIEGQPLDIPSSLEINVKGLDIGESLTVSDLSIPKKVDIAEEDESVIAVCTPPTKVETADSVEEIETEVIKQEVDEKIPSLA